MSVMEARFDICPPLLATVGTTMANRVGQRAARSLFAIATAMIFLPLTGPVPALAWVVVFLCLQGLEVAVFRNGRIRHHRDAWSALALIFASNLVFALFAVVLAARGGTVGIAVGMVMIAGSLIHAVLANGCSRFTVAAAAGPSVLALACLPVVMMIRGVAGQSILMLGCASLLLCWAAFGAWRRVADDMIALGRARLAAERANQAKSDFLTMISHEIRTPLNGVMGMAQSLATDPLTVSQRERLDTLIGSGQGLHDMIAEVIDLSRIEAGLLTLRTVPFDLREVVEKSIEPFSASARAKRLEVTVSLCPGLAPAYLGDPARIRQILHNLIANAIQLTDAGGVLVSASRDADGVRLSVCDSGRGVPESRLGAIFDKYAMLDPAGSRSGHGLGLGLFMANELVLRMNGSITATNRIPTGLCLTAALPLAVADVPRAEARTVQVPGALRRSLRVLAAEDHPVNRRVLALLLDQIDVVPTMVENGLAAVEACRTADWDLVLMDIQMPVLDGISAARQIGEEARASGRLPPPMIAVTANVMAHQLSDYTQAGMAFCIPKPVEAEVLFSAMRKALNSVDAAASARDAANGLQR